MLYDLEIVIPVFHEEGNILKTLKKILEKMLNGDFQKVEKNKLNLLNIVL